MSSTIARHCLVAALAMQASMAVASPPAPGGKVAATTSSYRARTWLGQPDLEGMWSANFLMSFEASKDAPTLTVPESEAKVLLAARVKTASAFFESGLDPEVPALLRSIDGLPIVRGERRTRLVTLPADGRLPYTAAARRELQGSPGDDDFDNPENRPNAERCLVGDGQPPFSTLTFGDQLQILQTRDYVVLHSEYGDDMRVIPFADRHGPPTFRSRLGDSIARWEGGTLVIETIRLPDADRHRLFPALIVSGDSTVVERLTRVSSRELLYQFTVIDPKVFSAPWSAEFSWYVTDKPMFEHACHEGNYSLSGILSGARHEEAAKAKATVAPHQLGPGLRRTGARPVLQGRA